MRRIFLLAFAAITANLQAQSAYGYQPVPVAPPPPLTPYCQSSYAPGYPQTLPVAVADPRLSRPLQMGGADVSSVVPLQLPGYELRVMDITKKITFDVNGAPVTAEVPIFIYMPRATASLQDSSKELRKIYNDLILIYDQDTVDKERIRSMLKRMDSIIDNFDSITPSVAKHSSSAY
jgi:hypothetical protein